VRMFKPPVVILALVLCINACAPQRTPSPFIPPQNSILSATSVAAQYTPPPQPTAVGNPPTPLFNQNPTSSIPCINSLHFVEDVTFPDGSIVRSGERIEKVWRVENNGTCSWDSRYRMRLVNGDQLGAPAELALYPARPGTQADLRIIFIAPSESRLYLSTWQAYDADGLAFGDPFYINIFVQSP
jgi:hypothetical protein